MDDYAALLANWKDAQETLEHAKNAERDLRDRLFAHYFIAPKEGVNKVDLANGWILKGTYKINRKVDEAALSTVREQLATVGVGLDAYIKYKPDLVMTAYRSLSDSTRAIFDQCLTVSPGAPTLELVAPKK